MEGISGLRDEGWRAGIPKGNTNTLETAPASAGGWSSGRVLFKAIKARTFSSQTRGQILCRSQGTCIEQNLRGQQDGSHAEIRPEAIGKDDMRTQFVLEILLI